MRRFAYALGALAVASAWLPLLGTPAAATFPGEGAQGRLAFVSSRPAIVGPGDIWTMNPDGSNPVTVTQTSSDDFRPRWGPKGKRIVFTSDRLGPLDIIETYEKGGHFMTKTRTGADDQSGSYDAERDAIIFQTDRDGDDEIYWMGKNGNAPRNLTNHPTASDIDPSVCANNRIVFASDRDRDPGDFEIYSMRLDGSDVKLLTESDDGIVNVRPSCSPDSSQVAFAGLRPAGGGLIGDGDPGPFDIWTVNADGSNLTNVTNNSGGNDDNPAWSPDGDLIAYDTDRYAGIPREIHTITPSGTDDTRITDNGVDDYEPDWQPVDDDDDYRDDPSELKDSTERGAIGSFPKSQPRNEVPSTSNSSSTSASGTGTQASGTQVAPASALPEVIVVKETATTVPEGGASSALKTAAVLAAAAAFVLTFVSARRLRPL